ncbi:DUF5862 family protein [Serratia proteamaculans]|uniref:DUF5862 domain-containing protein n=1 Tax=Serratia proteamaculans TaxID=28151 RepID=A0A5Q2VF66_SERPR|nr:hypothetical protein [Serratia proteamaculans]QGH62023.1 hypothetical protein GHV41_14835 [Serratia proteamaculans]
MRDLTSTEVEVVAGGWSPSISSSLEGAIYGAGDGLATGMAIGGTATKSNGLGLGVIAQAVGTVVGGVVGLAWGGIGGLILGKDEVTSLIHDYKENFGTGKG